MGFRKTVWVFVTFSLGLYGVYKASLCKGHYKTLGLTVEELGRIVNDSSYCHDIYNTVALISPESALPLQPPDHDIEPKSCTRA